jgi:hypothetical protein
MFNPKISGAFAGAGFILSFLVGIVAGVHVPLLLIRACIFAVVFFALSSAIYGAIRLYLPELFAGDSGSVPTLGTQVDISVGDDDNAGDISLESTGLGGVLNEFLENPGNSGRDTLDHPGEAVYTKQGLVEKFHGPSQAALPEATGFSFRDVDSVDTLPDLDSLSGVFNSTPVPMGGDMAGPGFPAGPLGGEGGQVKTKGPHEEFNVKEMASAIQTILKRENKG